MRRCSVLADYFGIVRILVAGFTRKTVTFENLRVNIDALSLVLDREIVVSSETSTCLLL